MSRPVLSAGTILLQDGLISAVGEEVSIPPEAWVIDGDGLTVYPGFIHSLSSLGLPSPKESNDKAKVSQGPQDRPATTPWQVAADQFQPKQKDLENWRNAGFTTVVLAPAVGIFPGHASVLNLGGATAAKSTVEPRAALIVRYPPPRHGISRDEFLKIVGYRGYPFSLLGRIAYVKQVFIDARYYHQVRAVYDEDARGLERPEYDRAIEPIAEALRNKIPVLYPANTSVQLRRALRTISSLVPETVLYGAQQGYDASSDLAQAGTSVLVDLNWPEPPKDPDPEEDVALRTLRFRDRAPASPASLADQGVRFGLYASQAKGPNDFFAGVRKAIEQGLEPADAVRALTLDAARLYGVADRLGSLDAGKIANLAVFEGDAFAEKARPKMVFIDGHKFDVPPAAEDDDKEDKEKETVK